MFSSRSKPRIVPDYQLYADQMFNLGYGIALWQPAPLPYYDKVKIGDVGYVRGGHFHLLFSAGCPLGDRELGRDVPLDFRPLDPLSLSVVSGQPRKPGALATRSIRVIGGETGVSVDIPAVSTSVSATYKFESTTKEGAVLMTKSPTTRNDAQRIQFFRDYILENLRSWVAFANGPTQGHGVAAEEIILVTGCDLTHDFAMIAFSQAGGHLAMGFDAGAANVASLGVSAWGHWRCDFPVFENWGPQDTAIDADSSENSADSASGQDSYKQFVKAGAGPHDLGPGDRDNVDDTSLSFASDSEESSEAVDVSSPASGRNDTWQVTTITTSKFRDPLLAIARYIFERSSAELACVHDMDYAWLLRGRQEENVDVSGIYSLLTLLAPSVSKGIQGDDDMDLTNATSRLSNTNDAMHKVPVGVQHPVGTRSSHDPQFESKTLAKAKVSGACARCKTLKVKCEFSDGDICKRCLAAGNHHCVIPGITSRHLLDQIREQATRIEELMKQLEEANMKANAQTTRALSSASTLVGDYTSDSNTVYDQTLLSPDVMDWIVGARESLQQFGGYINMGGSDSPKTRVLELEEADHLKSPLQFAIQEVNDVKFGYGAGAYTHGGKGKAIHERTKSRNHSEVPVNSYGRGSVVAAMPIDFMARSTFKSTNETYGANKSLSTVDEEEEGTDQDQGLGNEWVEHLFPKRLLNRNEGDQHLLLSNGIVTPNEVESLFTIYWNYMNLSTNLLDPELYTPQATYWRSPFLFTVVCAVASRFYTVRPALYQQAMHYAQLAAGTALIDGRHNVETVQAYTLLMLYPVPCHRWREGRTWIYLGLAIRIAMSLGLDEPNSMKPKNEQHARELLNRTRTWLAVFNFDRSIGSLYGKPPAISNTNYLAVHSDKWWNNSPYNTGFDVHVAAHNAGLRVLADFWSKVHSNSNNPTGLNENLDIAHVASDTDDALARLWETWTSILTRQNVSKDAQYKFRNGLLRLTYSYARLTTLSFGFQYGFAQRTHGTGASESMLWRCTRAAKDVLYAYMDEIATVEHKIYVRHGPDSQSIFVTFASTFLIKLLQPQYAPLVTRDSRIEIRELIGRLISVMQEIAADDRHCPMLYARFLTSLLATSTASVDYDHNEGPKGDAESEAPTPKRAKLDDGSFIERFVGSNPVSASPSPLQASQVDEQRQGTTGGEQDEHWQLPPTPPFHDYDYSSAPLPMEQEFLSSMQSLIDPASVETHDIMHGFQWMHVDP
ncbi:hypothetical protein EUX98_g4273 [Antrodiella citrinella]|uniref:Zn(2)-C6 fungal-type domain-containing protein n=1 Tax=Antrodiella citrinella TaxID=2447956 RepID=A0A4V3XIP1_9APHY|nr:hypothetical protein EUX98_g4273 [Antrodiella citrinella]